MASSDLLIGAGLAATVMASVPFVAEGVRPVRPGSAPYSRSGAEGYRTHYTLLGPEDGPLAVCVHGLTTPSFVWEAVAPELVKKGYRVLLYDLYGRGWSDCPGGLQTGAYFADQLEQLLGQLNISTPFLLLGYSMGGAVAASYAAKYPQRVQQLLLIAPAGFGHDLGAIPRLAVRLPLLGGALMRLFYPAAARRALEAERHMACAVDDMIDRQISETRWRGFAPSVWSSIRGMISEDLSPCHRRLATLGLPVLAIWGERDEVIPLAGMALLQDWNPDAVSVVIPDAGHSLPYTHVSELVSACETVLS